MKYNKEYYDQCFKACKVSREELGPAELIRYTRLADTSAILSGREYDTLSGLVQHGPLAVGCEPSKAGRSDLIQKGLCVAVVVKGDPSHYAATNDGYEVWRMYEASRADGGIKPAFVETPKKNTDKPRGSVFFQVPSAELQAFELKHDFPISVVRDLGELKVAMGDRYVVLVGSASPNSPYNWILESGEEVQVFSGYALVSPSGHALRNKILACGELWDPVQHVHHILKKLPASREWLLQFEVGKAVAISGDDALNELFELGALIPTSNYEYRLSELGTRVREMLTSN